MLNDRTDGKFGWGYLLHLMACCHMSLAQKNPALVWIIIVAALLACVIEFKLYLDCKTRALARETASRKSPVTTALSPSACSAKSGTFLKANSLAFRKNLSGVIMGIMEDRGFCF